MLLNRLYVLFGRHFPRLCSATLAGAVVLWAGAVWVAITDVPPQPSTASQGVNWQDIAPTCDQVLCELGKAHVSVRDNLVKYCAGETSLVDFDSQMILAKRRLRKVNIGGLDEPEFRDELFRLRDEQIRLYSEIRYKSGVFMLDDSEAEPPRPSDRTLAGWQASCAEVWGELGSFADKANILPDEMSDDKVAKAIFAQFYDLTDAVESNSLTATSDGVLSADDKEAGS